MAYVAPELDLRLLIPAKCPFCEQDITLLPWTLLASLHFITEAIVCPVSGEPVCMELPIPHA